MRDTIPTEPPGPDECKVVFYRTSAVSTIAQYPVFHGDKPVGMAEQGCYFEIRVPPGEHLFTSAYGHAGAVFADLAPGKTYFIKAHYHSYFWEGCYVASGGVALTPLIAGSSDWEKLQKKLRHLQCRELDPDQTSAFQESWAGLAHQIEEQFRNHPDDPGVKYLLPLDGR
jgi:hypothetical protein